MKTEEKRKMKRIGVCWRLGGNGLEGFHRPGKRLRCVVSRPCAEVSGKVLSYVHRRP